MLYVLGHEVEVVRGQRYSSLSEWLGYGIKQNSWEPAENLISDVLKEHWDTKARFTLRQVWQNVVDVGMVHDMNRRRK